MLGTDYPMLQNLFLLFIYLSNVLATLMSKPILIASVFPRCAATNVLAH